MEEQKSGLTEYEPIDVSTIRPCKIATEKELDQEAANICEILKDIKGDWDKRLKSLLLVQQCIVSDHTRRLNNFPQFMNKLINLLTIQLTDLRSQITKEASKAISLMAQVMQSDFEPLAPKFISKNSLYKLLNAAKLLMAEHSHHCIVAILNNVVAPKVIPNIYEEVKSKNPYVRTKNAEYLYIILSTYPEESISNYIPQLEDLLLQLIQDAKGETRQIARMSFFLYKEILPERAHSLFIHLDPQYQRAILEEEECYASNDGAFSPIRFAESHFKSRSPQKTMKQQPVLVNPEANGGLTVNSAGGNREASFKQTRSVSRGKAPVASNNLSQKAGTQQQLKSPRVDDMIMSKRGGGGGGGGLGELSISQQVSEQTKMLEPLQSTAIQGTTGTDQLNTRDNLEMMSPKVDSSKLRLLKSPRTSNALTNKIDLKISTKPQEFSNESGGTQQQFFKNDILSVIHEAKGSLTLGSPGLPPERQQQLKNLKDKKQQTQGGITSQNNNNNNDSLNLYNSVPVSGHVSQRSSMKIPNPNSMQLIKSPNAQGLQQNIGFSPPKKSNVKQTGLLNVQNEEGNGHPKQNKNSVSPARQSMTITSKVDSRRSTQQQKQDFNKSSEIGALNQLSNQSKQPIQLPNAQKQRSLKQESVSSISNSTKLPSNNLQYSKQQSSDSEIIRDIINSSDEQKIFDELDFINQIDSLDSLVKSAQSNNWQERARSFSMIQRSESQLQECSDQMIKKLFRLHIGYLDDSNAKVVKAVQDSFMVLISYNKALIDRYLDEVIPILLTNMVGSVQSVSVSSSDLINLICLYSKPSDIILIIMDILKDKRDDTKVVTASLEVLVVLLGDDVEYCQKNANVVETCNRIVGLLEVNEKSMDVIMPSIAVLLAMRDKNPDGMMKALMALKPLKLARVRKLTLAYAPDFDADIGQFVGRGTGTSNNSSKHSSPPKMRGGVKIEGGKQKVPGQTQDNYSPPPLGKTISAKQSNTQAFNQGQTAIGHQKHQSQIPSRQKFQNEYQFNYQEQKGHDNSGQIERDNGYEDASNADEQLNQIEDQLSFEKSQKSIISYTNTANNTNMNVSSINQADSINGTAVADFSDTGASNANNNAQQLPPLFTNEENLVEPAQEIDNRVPHKINSKLKQFLNGGVDDSNNDTPQSQDNQLLVENSDDDEDGDEQASINLQTQNSQHNYLISKQGDTIDDEDVEDIMTPTPSNNYKQDNFTNNANKNGQQTLDSSQKQDSAKKEQHQQNSNSKKGVEEIKVQIDEVHQNLQRSTLNKRDYIIQIQGLLKDPENEMWEGYYEDVQKSLFDMMKEDDVEIRDLASQTLQQIVAHMPLHVENHIEGFIEELASVFSYNKKLAKEFEGVLQELTAQLSSKGKEQLFGVINEKISEQESPLLQTYIKICSYLLKIQPQSDIDKCFAIVFDNFYKLMGHSSANVRKGLVFCMVDMNFYMTKADYETYLNKFNSNQQKLITIYIERKNGGSGGAAE